MRQSKINKLNKKNNINTLNRLPYRAPGTKNILVDIFEDLTGVKQKLKTQNND